MASSWESHFFYFPSNWCGRFSISISILFLFLFLFLFLLCNVYFKRHIGIKTFNCDWRACFLFYFFYYLFFSFIDLTELLKVLSKSVIDWRGKRRSVCCVLFCFTNHITDLIQADCWPLIIIRTNQVPLSLDFLKKQHIWYTQY